MDVVNDIIKPFLKLIFIALCDLAGWIGIITILDKFPRWIDRVFPEEEEKNEY